MKDAAIRGAKDDLMGYFKYVDSLLWAREGIK